MYFRLSVPIAAFLISYPTMHAAQAHRSVSWAAYPLTNAAYRLDETGDPSASSEFIKFIGSPYSSLDTCSDAAASWRNETSPDIRCLTAVFFHTPINVSYLDHCYCLVDPKWIPVESAEADSARLLWPCTSDIDCSLNGICRSSGECECDHGWKGLRCGELSLGPVDRLTPGYRGINGELMVCA